MSISFDTGATSIRTAAAFAELGVSTVCLWFKPASVTGNNIILGTDGAWEARLVGADMRHEFRQGTVPDMTTVFAVGTWYHLAFTFNGARKGAYVNGAVDPAWGLYSTVAVGTDTVLALGTSLSIPGEGMAGELEDVRMYNRVLSQKEVQLIADNDGGDDLLEGLQHWWTMQSGVDGAVVTLEPDLIGKVNMSVIVNSPVYTKSFRRIGRRAA